MYYKCINDIQKKSVYQTLHKTGTHEQIPTRHTRGQGRGRHKGEQTENGSGFTGDIELGVISIAVEIDFTFGKLMPREMW